MKSFLLKTIPTTGLILLFAAGLYAQDKAQKLRFNGLGRTTLQNTNYGGAIQEGGTIVNGTAAARDTSNGPRVTDGEFLLDLAINATPNEKNEVQTILRLRNEFGGFFGAGMSVEIRELWARGIIANRIRYHVGDMDLVQTPFTLFNPDEEGTVNEPEVFKAQKEIIHYENFYKPGNTRRMQGAKVDFGLEFSQVIDEMEFEGYITRVRGTDFFTVPNRFVAGGNIDFIENKYGRLGLHYVNTFDDRSVGAIETGIKNQVYTLDGDISLFENSSLALGLKGEAGMSSLRLEKDTVIRTVLLGIESEEEEVLTLLDKDDSFAEVIASVKVKSLNLEVDLGYRDVGPDFFSTAAQSKRIDFNRDTRYFNRIGNDRFVRPTTIFDISRDPNLYTFQLSEQLMAYDLRLSNVLPYGKATPNRRGLIAGIQYQDSAQAFQVDVDAAFLSEIRGQGTDELKNFTLIRVAGDLNIHNLLSWKKQFVVNIGLQLEQTSRGGEAVEQVDLSSTLFEAGIQKELFDDFDLLLGAKLLVSNGSDYIPVLENYNDVLDFPGRTLVDDTETLLGAGIRYRFKKDIYVTAQYQSFDFARATSPENDFSFSQLFIIYSMNF